MTRFIAVPQFDNDDILNSDQDPDFFRYWYGKNWQEKLDILPADNYGLISVIQADGGEIDIYRD